MLIDTNTEFGARVTRRLRDELIVWLTTVRSDGTPEPSPVWFLWDGSTFLIYSQPNKQKLRDIADDPKVALNFNGDELGGDIVIFTGEARIDQSAPPADQVPEYVDKYRLAIQRIGMDPGTFAKGYSVPVRVTPTKLRGH